MNRQRRGNAVTIMLTVVATVTALTPIALPGFSTLVERNRLSAARDEITSAIATARSSAMQKGRSTTVRFSSNRMWVTAVSANSGATTVVPAKSFLALYNVSVAASDSILTFDSRGVATPSRGARGIVIVGRSGRSVCVTAGQMRCRN